MKWIFLFIVCIFACGCNGGRIENNTIYKGHKYDIVKLNDTTFVVVAGLNGDKNFKPVVINSKDVSKFAE